MTINIEQMRAEQKWEMRKFIIQVALASAALLGAGAALATLVLHLTGKI